MFFQIEEDLKLIFLKIENVQHAHMLTAGKSLIQWRLAGNVLSLSFSINVKYFPVITFLFFFFLTWHTTTLHFDVLILDSECCLYKEQGMK